MSGIIGKNASRSSGVIGTAAVGIASLAADSSPQLGGFLDAAGNYIQMEKGGDIASASPTVIDTDGDYFAVTGTTNFSAFTVAADRHFFLEFGGALTMTHGGGTLDLPGAANITTAASDVGEFVSTAANVVTCVNYTKRDGGAVKIIDESIDSDHYVDGSIDLAHMSAESVDSDQYVDGSIDTAHIATNQIDETLMKDAFVGDFTDVTVTAADTFLYGDTTDSGNTKKDTIQGILDLAGGGLTTKLIGGSYDLSTTGTLAVTGVGFQPTALLFFIHKDGATAGSWGLVSSTVTDDGNVHKTGANMNSAGTLWTLYVDGSNAATGVLASYDSDGATFTKSKSGSPTGTGYFKVLYMK